LLRQIEIRLETGPLQYALKAQDACVSDLLASWGYAKSATTGPKTLGSAWDWVQDAYESKAFSKHLLRMRFRLDVTEKGDVSGCHPQATANDEQGKAAALPAPCCSAMGGSARPLTRTASPWLRPCSS
jgi:hypothetical protein